MKIMIATPCAQNKLERNYVQSLLTETFLHPSRLEQQAHYDLGINLIGGVSGLGKDRGVMASTALRLGFDKLMFIDADQSWTWPQLKTILDSDKPIVGGIVALKKYPIQLNFTPRDEDKKYYAEEGGWATFKGLHRHQANFPNTSELPVARMGTAFMCIDVNVLKVLSKTECPMFKHKEDLNGVSREIQCWDFFQTGVIGDIYHGEDWAFCTLAARQGFQCYINPNVQIPHHGHHEYRPGFELKAEKYEIGDFVTDKLVTKS